MGIPKRHFQIRVPQYPLQSQQIPTIHHEVAGEGVAQM